MAIEITITQKGLVKRALPFEVIVADQLKWGAFDGFRLEVGAINDNEFIAYNENHIGRGFSVDWKQGEKQQVYLRLPIPSHDAEIDDFYDTILRIADFWKNCEINQDGTVISLADLPAERSRMKEFNLRIINDFANDQKRPTHDETGDVYFDLDASGNRTGEATMVPHENDIIFYSAMWPLILGVKEKALFTNATDATAFQKFLHEKQSLDAYYAKPQFYHDQDTSEIFGNFALTENCVSIFPLKPTAPWWMTDAQTGEALKVDRWSISLYSATKEAVIGNMSYEEFLERVPHTEYYDAGQLLINEISLTEMEALLGETVVH